MFLFLSSLLSAASSAASSSSSPSSSSSSSSSSSFNHDIPALHSYTPLHIADLNLRFYTQHERLLVTLPPLIGGGGDSSSPSLLAILTPLTHIFHSHFTVHTHNSTHRSRLNTGGSPTAGHYIGQIDGLRDSEVVLHVEEGIQNPGSGSNQNTGHHNRETIMGTIELGNRTFYIEPSDRHISTPHDFELILYERSEARFNISETFCGLSTSHGDPLEGDWWRHLPPLEPSGYRLHSRDEARSRGDARSRDDEAGSRDTEKTRRRKRSAPRSTCEVVLVADYKFHSIIGKGKEYQTKSYLVALFERIDRIFRTTSFDTSHDSFTDYGMQIREIVIHTEYSSNPGEYNFNQKWAESDLLDSFGYGNSKQQWTDFCLAHLFTYQDFERGVLGLAYVANPMSNKVGGICASPYLSGTGRKRMLNVGLSTSVNYERTLLSTELELVAAHELGHNWGSSHDDDQSKTCAPENNRFIMFPSAVDGSRSNNKLFSPCSRSAIGSVLQYKSGCFTERSVTVCGNGIVEEEEECDAGGEEDPCCSTTCQFSAGAVCSDLESECCESCQFAGPTKVCYVNSESDVFNACVREKRCSANAAKCSEFTYKALGEPCYDRGTCDGKGTCRDFCASKGLKLCQITSQPCHWSCLSGNVCVASNFTLPDGMLCPSGVCSKGTCLVEPQTQVKIWNLISTLTPSKFLIWMGNNIVLVVILFTSIFWIPVSLFVAWLDRGQDEVDYMTMRFEDSRKERLKNQMSTVSSRSFELKTHLVSTTPPEEQTRIFAATGARF